MSTTPAQQPAPTTPPNRFELVLQDILKAALIGGAEFGPILIHSTKGIAILNASEGTLGMVTGLIQAKQA